MQAKPGPLIIRRQSHNFSHQATHSLVKRKSYFVDDTRKDRRRLREFVDHETEMPVGKISAHRTLQPQLDELPQYLLGRSLLLDHILENLDLRGPYGTLQYRQVQALLVAKVVVNCG